MKYGLSIPNFATPGALLDVAETAEAAGWDGFFLWDHLVIDRAAPPPVSGPGRSWRRLRCERPASGWEPS